MSALDGSTHGRAKRDQWPEAQQAGRCSAGSHKPGGQGQHLGLLLMHYLDDLDLAGFIADGIAQLEAFLYKHALFQIYCDVRDNH